MKSFFEVVVNVTSNEELRILAFLYEESADSIFKSISRRQIQNRLAYKEAEIRKCLLLLQGKQFVLCNTHTKEKKYFISDFGVRALNYSLEKAGV
ncbi:hypothetical protein [Shouchella clausii]|uniref:hypothetical protein n=1 Tax=Shouchella clausii TaxID=79880 RepID=UPI001C733374|nr:hypothetical protein [Shouchella clausii]MBX0320169.1 hypothetical protein [Shouchella clausii]MEB5480816.1 hypothetical protein [Shouchella clausii]